MSTTAPGAAPPASTPAARHWSRIGEATLPWSTGDVFVAPPWRWVEHRNGADGAPACLFQFSDEPTLRALGLFQEEAN